MGYEKKLLHINNDVHFVLNYLEQMIFHTSTLLSLCYGYNTQRTGKYYMYVLYFFCFVRVSGGEMCSMVKVP